MSTTVYSIRIPKEIREMMEKLKDVNWQEEIRKIVEEKVKEEYKKKLLNEARELRRKMKTNISASKLIREDRDER